MAEPMMDLPEPLGEGIRNHEEMPPFKLKPVMTLENLALDTYMSFLEAEAVSYISLSQSPSRLLGGMAEQLLRCLKSQLNSKMSGIASSVLRQKMMDRILSEEFPTGKHCQRTDLLKRDNANSMIPTSLDDTFTSNCISPCCSGAFIREVMAGIVMSCDIRTLLFTADKMPTASRAVTLIQRGPRHIIPSATAVEFNVPVVLTHLLATTQDRHSQLERIVFSEAFVKEVEENFNNTNIEPNATQHSSVKTNREILYKRLQEKQKDFTKNFGQGDICETSDRRGVALNMLILFRDVLTPRNNTFNKLTELVLKNNIQCDLYSKASFQFELLARIGSSCPRLRVLDIFGTDTWADCLVAFFFRDVFHSLHRYLFFMENEEDESSAYHPHDTTRYCQFCLDQLHPTSVERPFTNNPVIPLVDEIYDHVIKRYPKRSLCILRNCIKVSDLIHSTTSNVFELVRNQSPLMMGRSDFINSSKKKKNNRTDSPERDNSSIGSRLRNRHKRRRSESNMKSFQQQNKKRKNESKQKAIVQEVPATLLGEESSSARRSSRIRKSKCDTCCRLDLPGSRPSSSLASSSSTSEIHSQKEEEQEDGTPEEEEEEEEDKRTVIDTQTNGILTRLRKRKLHYDEEELDENNKFDVSSSSKSARTSSGHFSRMAKSQHTKKKGSLSETPFCDIKLTSKSAGEDPMEFKDWLSQSSKCYCKESKKKCEVNQQPSSQTGQPMKVDLPIRCEALFNWNYDHDWVDPVEVKYREISGWPHLNECLQTLEVLNIGGTNVLGEFIPFILLHVPKLRSLGQWINTMIYGLEILKSSRQKNLIFPNICEFSYSTDRNYFCQPYIGFVPESPDFRRVRKEMVRFSGKVAKRINNSNRNHQQKRSQIYEDMALMTETCPNVKKLNVVVHYKSVVLDEVDPTPWTHLSQSDHLQELDLVTMRFANVRTLLRSIGQKLTSLTLEMDDEQGSGSEIVHIGRNCPNLVSLRLLIGDKVLKGEMTLHFGSQFFRRLERLEVEGTVHLHAFAFLWGHCRILKYMKMGLVISNDHVTSNVLILDVFTLMFQVNGMELLEEMHLKNLKVKSLQMGKFLLDNLPKLKNASNWILDIANDEHIKLFKNHLRQFVNRGLKLEFKEW